MPIVGVGHAAETSTLVRAKLQYAVSMTEQFLNPKQKKPKNPASRADRIANLRDRAIASLLTRELAELDPGARYEFNVRARPAPDLPYGLIDLEMRPNMIVAEFIGRSEGALLLKALIRINPGNQNRYVLKSLYGLEIQK